MLSSSILTPLPAFPSTSLLFESLSLLSSKLTRYWLILAYTSLGSRKYASVTTSCSTSFLTLSARSGFGKSRALMRGRALYFLVKRSGFMSIYSLCILINVIMRCFSLCIIISSYLFSSSMTSSFRFFQFHIFLEMTIVSSSSAISLSLAGLILMNCLIIGQCEFRYLTQLRDSMLRSRRASSWYVM